MAFKLIEPAPRRWHRITPGHLAALVRAGAVFGGVLVENQLSQTEVAA
jgi:hypothetical protein